MNIDRGVGISLQPAVFVVTKGVSLDEQVSDQGATAVTLRYLEIPLPTKLSPPGIRFEDARRPSGYGTSREPSHASVHV